jgi:hypothetical protein
VNAGQKKSRTSLFVLLILFILVLIICIELMRYQSKTPLLVNTPVQSPPRLTETPTPAAAPVDTGSPVHLDAELPAVELRYAPSITPRPAGAIAAYRNGNGTFAVVNLERIVSTYSTNGISTNALARLMPGIMHAVDVQASARGFALVFDVSAKSFNKTSLFLATNEAPDITQEVIQALSQ